MDVWLVAATAFFFTNVVVILLAVQLAGELRRQIEIARPLPIGYPLPKSVLTALLEKLDSDEGVELTRAARSSILDDDIDITIWLSTREPLPSQYAKEIFTSPRASGGGVFPKPSLDALTRWPARWTTSSQGPVQPTTAGWR